MQNDNFSYLTIEQKKRLLNHLIKKNYCEVLSELVMSLGVKKNPVSEQMAQNLLCAVDFLSSKDCDFIDASIKPGEFVLNIDYPLGAFLKEVSKILDDAEITRTDSICTCFGFTLGENSLKFGYPVICKDEHIFDSLNDEKEIKTAKRLAPLVERFCTNKISLKNYPKTQKVLNDMIKVFPEFLTIIGNVQHRTHDFTLDIHILKVMQYIVKDVRFTSLSPRNRRILLLTAFLHDLTKKEHRVDKSHAPQSAYAAAMIMDKVPLNEDAKNKIFLLIKNHDFLEKYNKGLQSAQEIASEYKTKELFKSACILTDADLHSVKSDGSFFYKYKDIFEEAMAEINAYYSNK